MRLEYELIVVAGCSSMGADGLIAYFASSVQEFQNGKTSRGWVLRIYVFILYIFDLRNTADFSKFDDNCSTRNLLTAPSSCVSQLSSNEKNRDARDSLLKNHLLLIASVVAGY